MIGDPFKIRGAIDRPPHFGLVLLTRGFLSSSVFYLGTLRSFSAARNLSQRRRFPGRVTATFFTIRPL